MSGYDKKRDELLQRYFDGELTAEERAEVEGAMTPDDELRLAALAEMRAVLGAALEGSSAEIDLLPGIEAQLQAGAAPSVAPPNGAEAAAAPVDELARRRGRGRGVRAWVATTMAMAVAAAFLVVAKPWQGGPLGTESDVEDLETEGTVVATIIKVSGESERNQATVIWTHDDDDDDDDDDDAEEN